jgi:predicted permease
LKGALAGAFQAALQRDVDSIDDDDARRVFLQQTLAFDAFGLGFSSLRGRFALPLYALLGMAAVILLIACANAASLLLARSDARRRELAIRLAIGAGRGRIIRQLVTEGALLVTAACAVGLLFANWAGDVLVRRALATSGPPPFSATVDLPVLIFTAGMAVAAVLLFAIAPALRSTPADLAQALRATAPNIRAAMSLQRLLIVMQIALSVAVLAGAGLLVSSLRNYLRVDLGFDAEHVLSAWISPRANGIVPGRLNAVYRDLVAAAESVPGVRSASVATCGLVVNCENASNVLIDGYEPLASEQIHLQENEVGPRYFDTVGMRIVEGRGFTERDSLTSPKVAVVNRATVRRYFHGQSPIGSAISDGRGRFEIVGVVDDARVNRVQEQAPPMAFYPIAQMQGFAGTVDVRATSDPGALAATIRRTLSAVDPRLPVDRVTLVSRQVELNLTQQRLVAELASLFGILAIGLTALGLFALLSYIVSRRTSELGLRIALGASRSRVSWTVIRDVLAMTAIGLAVGIPATLAIARTLGGLLYGVTPTDPATVLSATAIIVIAAATAAFIPVWRASHVDPIIALRAE